jgi:hypothetical protein
MANASAQGSQRDGVDARAAALTAVDNAACLLFFTSRDCPDDSVVSLQLVMPSNCSCERRRTTEKKPESIGQ